MYNYYTRLTIVHPKDVNTLDITKGRILAETATTGKFVMGDITWDTHVAPNSITSIAFHATGNMKIYEPLGVRFFDYIRFAAVELGMENHFDARYFLEVEIVSEDLPDNSNFKYIWPIMITIMNIKGGVSERGTEYDLDFIHCGGHSQLDMVQPIKEPLKVDSVSKLGEYLKQFGRKLELMEFKYAEAGQKAGASGSPGGDHPSEQDPYHDEYHFILDPRIENWTISNKGASDNAVQGTWFGLGSIWGSYNVTAKSGSTIVGQIQRVLASLEESQNLYLLNYGDQPGAGKSATQSSDANKKTMEALLGKIYNFFRVETHTVYKEFDYIRARYAVKHVFIIYAALQPNLYQYPDELDQLNLPENEGKVKTKLKAYVQEGLLRKAYYHMYTGLNTEIIKLNIQLSPAYYLPSFPQIWPDRGVTGPGAMKPYNNNRNISPYARSSSDIATRTQIVKNQQEQQKLTEQLKKEKDSDKQLILKTQIAQRKAAEEELKGQLSTQSSSSTSNTPISDRAGLLASLKNLYAEDLVYREALAAATGTRPAHRPRMEPDTPVSKLDEKKDENGGLMDKIFTVMLSSTDLMMLDMEVRADPYWLGQPNIVLSGKQYIDKLDLPPALLDKINQEIPKIDPDFASRVPHWGDYTNGAKFHKGGSLIYFNAQLPVNDIGQDDLMQFDTIDQIIGIYQVIVVKQEFKGGQWTQTLNCQRDLTIPSKYLPRASAGDLVWEDYVDQAVKDPNRALDQFNQEKQNKVSERDNNATDQGLSKLTGEQGMGAAGVVPDSTTSTKQNVKNAQNIFQEKLSNNPAPAITEPVANAENLMAQGLSKQEAYSKAKAQFTRETSAYYNHLEDLNKQAYKEAGVTDYKPYSADTMTGLVIQRSGSGGLEDWKANNTQRPGAWALNNPGGLGFDAKTGRSNQYDTFNQGMEAVNNYYNYGTGVSANGRQGSDRYLLPTTNNANATGQFDYIKQKSIGTRQ